MLTWVMGWLSVKSFIAVRLLSATHVLVNTHQENHKFFSSVCERRRILAKCSRNRWNLETFGTGVYSNITEAWLLSLLMSSTEVK